MRLISNLVPFASLTKQKTVFSLRGVSFGHQGLQRSIQTAGAVDLKEGSLLVFSTQMRNRFGERPMITAKPEILMAQPGTMRMMASIFNGEFEPNQRPGVTGESLQSPHWTSWQMPAAASPYCARAEPEKSAATRSRAGLTDPLSALFFTCQTMVR